MLLRHFQVFFNIAGKNYLFLFVSKTHKKFPSQEEKKWLVSQLAAKWAASKQNNDNFIQSTSTWAWPKGSNRAFSAGGGGPTYFSNFPHQATLEMLENIINSKTNPSALTKLPASSSEHLLFCQPARFLWGTNKVRNRFLVCPWVTQIPSSQSKTRQIQVWFYPFRTLNS